MINELGAQSKCQLPAFIPRIVCASGLFRGFTHDLGPSPLELNVGTVRAPLLQSREERTRPETPISVRRRHHSGPERRAACYLRPSIESRSQDGRNRKEGGTL